MAHPGAAEYINDEIKSFVERYADLMYFAPAALSIIGTIFAVSRSLAIGSQGYDHHESTIFEALRNGTISLIDQ